MGEFQKTQVNGTTMLSFQDADAFRDYVRTSGNFPDCVCVSGTAYTMEEYDSDWKTVRYWNRRTGTNLEITTSNRYGPKGLSDAEVEECSYGTYRPDVSYVD